MPAKALFSSISGKWSGWCRPRFEPDKLADESTVKGHKTRLFQGRFLRHAYECTIHGKPRKGGESIALEDFLSVIELDKGHGKEYGQSCLLLP